VEDWVSPMVASDINNAVVKTKPSAKGSKGVDTKKRAKEEERLKQAGKCPQCAGMGKSPDGQYTCAACNGTGKYTDNSKKVNSK